MRLSHHLVTSLIFLVLFVILTARNVERAQRLPLLEKHCVVNVSDGNLPSFTALALSPHSVETGDALHDQEVAEVTDSDQDVNVIQSRPLREELRYALGRKIDINRASPIALQMLPGIGRVRAKHIVDFRRRTGTFNSLEELLEVKGIGPETLQRLKGRVSCSDFAVHATNANSHALPQ